VTKTNFRKCAPGDLRRWPLGGPGILSKGRHVWYGPEIKREYLKLVPFQACRATAAGISLCSDCATITLLRCVLSVPLFRKGIHMALSPSNDRAFYE